MKYLIKNTPLLSLILLLTSFPAMASEKQYYITMHIPQSVIRQTLAEITPLSVQTASKNLEGTITIARIAKLKLEHNKILARVHLIGDKLNVITQVAGQNIRLQLGRAEVEIDCQVQVRYNAKNKTLYLRPLAKNIEGADTLKQGDVGESLLILFHNKEFPVTVQELKPILAKAANTSIVIEPRIANIQVVEQAIQMLFIPKITKKISR